MNDIQRTINHLTMLRKLDSGEKKKLYDVAISAIEKQIPKLAEHSEPFGKFKCPSCGEMYDACYEEETGEPSLWFRYCPDCGQCVVTQDFDTDGRNWDEN